MASSVRGFYSYIALIKIARKAGKVCSVGFNGSNFEHYATNVVLWGLGVNVAHAAPYCDQQLVNLVQDISTNTAKYGDEAQEVARQVTEFAVALNKMNVEVSVDTLKVMERLAGGGHGDHVVKFFNNVRDGRLGNMDSGSNGMGRLLEDGDTVMDKFFDALNKVPEGVEGEAEFFVV